VLAERGDREGGDELRRRPGHHDAHRGAAVAQPANQFEALIGGDPARDDQQYPPAVQHAAPPCPTAQVCYRPLHSARAIAISAAAANHSGASSQATRRARWPACAIRLSAWRATPSRDHKSTILPTPSTSRGSASIVWARV